LFQYWTDRVSGESKQSGNSFGQCWNPEYLKPVSEVQPKVGVGEGRVIGTLGDLRKTSRSGANCTAKDEEGRSNPYGRTQVAGNGRNPAKFERGASPMPRQRRIGFR
jgi:hypothetical protein